MSFLVVSGGEPALEAPKADLSIAATPVGNVSPTSEAMRDILTLPTNVHSRQVTTGRKRHKGCHVVW